MSAPELTEDDVRHLLRAAVRDEPPLVVIPAAVESLARAGRRRALARGTLTTVAAAAAVVAAVVLLPGTGAGSGGTGPAGVTAGVQVAGQQPVAGSTGTGRGGASLAAGLSLAIGAAQLAAVVALALLARAGRARRTARAVLDVVAAAGAWCAADHLVDVGAGLAVAREGWWPYPALTLPSLAAGAAVAVAADSARLRLRGRRRGTRERVADALALLGGLLVALVAISVLGTLYRNGELRPGLGRTAALLAAVGLGSLLTALLVAAGRHPRDRVTAAAGRCGHLAAASALAAAAGFVLTHAMHQDLATRSGSSLAIAGAAVAAVAAGGLVLGDRLASRRGVPDGPARTATLVAGCCLGTIWTLLPSEVVHRSAPLWPLTTAYTLLLVAGTAAALRRPG